VDPFFSGSHFEETKYQVLKLELQTLWKDGKACIDIDQDKKTLYLGTPIGQIEPSMNRTEGDVYQKQGRGKMLSICLIYCKFLISLQNPADLFSKPRIDGDTASKHQEIKKWNC